MVWDMIKVAPPSVCYMALLIVAGVALALWSQWPTASPAAEGLQPATRQRPSECPPFPNKPPAAYGDMAGHGYTGLCEFGQRYGTDKSPLVNAQHVRHLYTMMYHALFFDKREMVRKVLELGVGGGFLGEVWTPAASGRMWMDYFCNARIYVSDLDSAGFFNDTRLTCMVSDQSKPSSLHELVDTIQGMDSEPTELFDLILDDAAHVPEFQLTSLATLWPYVKENGFYIIEDLNYDHKPTVDRLRLLDEFVPTPQGVDLAALRRVRLESRQFVMNSPRYYDGIVAYLKVASNSDL